jgi:hypothetical protein
MSISGKQPGMASEFSVDEKNDNQQDVQKAGTIESIPPSLPKRVDAWLRLESAGPHSDLGPWSNADLEPTAASQQTWNSWNCKFRYVLLLSGNTDVPHSCGILALRCDRSRQLKAWILSGDHRIILEISCRHHSSRTLPGSPSDHRKRHHRREIAHTVHHTEPCAFRLLLLVLRRLRETPCRLLLVRDQHLQWSTMRVCRSCGDMAVVRQCP